MPADLRIDWIDGIVGIVWYLVQQRLCQAYLVTNGSYPLFWLLIRNVKFAVAEEFVIQALNPGNKISNLLPWLQLKNPEDLTATMAVELSF